MVECLATSFSLQNSQLSALPQVLKTEWIYIHYCPTRIPRDGWAATANQLLVPCMWNVATGKPGLNPLFLFHLLSERIATGAARKGKAVQQEQGWGILESFHAN